MKTDNRKQKIYLLQKKKGPRDGEREKGGEEDEVTQVKMCSGHTATTHNEYNFMYCKQVIIKKF